MLPFTEEQLKFLKDNKLIKSETKIKPLNYSIMNNIIIPNNVAKKLKRLVNAYELDLQILIVELLKKAMDMPSEEANDFTDERMRQMLRDSEWCSKQWHF